MDTNTRNRERGLFLLRIVTGWVFLWAGIEKLLQLAGHGAFDASGFLKFGTAGTWPGVADGVASNPFQSFWAGFASDAGAMTVINFIVPFGEVAIGRP